MRMDGPRCGDLTHIGSNTLGTTSKIGLWCSKCGDLAHVFASDPRFANFTQVGLRWWVNLAHHGSLRQMQQGLWYNNNDQLISYRNNEPVIVTNYENLF